MEYSLSVNEEDIRILGLALGELPFKVSAPVVNKFQAQVNKQVADAVKQAEDEAAKKLEAVS